MRDFNLSEKWGYMRLEDIKIGSILEIVIKRGASEYKTNSKIEYSDAKMIGVPPIASEHGLFRFTEDDSVDLIYHEDEKYWKWENVKAGLARRRDGRRLHVFSSMFDGKSFNRRTQFRFEIGEVIRMRYEKIKENREEPAVNGNTPEADLDNIFLMLNEQYEEIECKGYLKDLSEGGASVESDVKLSRGDFISFSIDSEVGTVMVRGVVLRVIEDKRGYFDYTYGVSFVETSKNYMRYFYLQQRKQLYENNDT